MNILGLFWVRVRGESMWPELVPGRRYLAASFLRPRKGDVVVAKLDTGRIIVKLLVEKKGDEYILGSLVSWGSEHIARHRDILGVLVHGRVRRRYDKKKKFGK